MQSFFQYRRFRDAAKAQIERDRERAQRRTLRDGAADTSTGEAHSPSSPNSEDSKIDVEKGGELHETPFDTQRVYGVSATATNGKYRRPDVLEATEEKDQPLEEDEDEDDDFELGQHARSNLSRITTQQSAGTALGTTLSGIEVRKRTTREGGDGSVFVVGYESANDPNDPVGTALGRILIRTT
jgi:hypothetical protein